jgi:hypothetical protein
MLYAGRRTIAGNACAGSGEAAGGQGRGRLYHGRRGAGAAAGLRRSPAGAVLTSTYAREAPCPSFLKFLTLPKAVIKGLLT